VAAARSASAVGGQGTGVQLGESLPHGDGGQAHLTGGLLDGGGVEAVVGRSSRGVGLEIGGAPQHEGDLVAVQPVRVTVRCHDTIFAARRPFRDRGPG
jgi:hypothetical protein